MTGPSLTHFVLDQEESELLEQLAGVKASRELLDFEIKMLEQAIAFKRAMDPSSVEADLDDMSGGISTREAIMALLNMDPSRGWEPAELHEELIRRGVDKKPSAIRMMLQRMHNAGELERPAPGTYILPHMSSSRYIGGPA